MAGSAGTGNAQALCRLHPGIDPASAFLDDTRVMTSSDPEQISEIP